MRISAADIGQQLRLGEDSLWEFKQVEFRNDRPTAPRRTDLADELAAFANAEGGVILFGVTDAGQVQGMTRAQLDALERFVVEVCNDSIQPQIEADTYRHDLDGRMILAVSIAAGYALHNSPGGSYRRTGSSKRRMTSDQALRLAQRRGQSRFLWFDEQPVAGTGFCDPERGPLETAAECVGCGGTGAGIAQFAPADPRRARCIARHRGRRAPVCGTTGTLVSECHGDGNPVSGLGPRIGATRCSGDSRAAAPPDC